jgi:hypothetical protein
VNLANDISVVPAMPRTSTIQFHRDNTPADKVSDYFRRSVTLPMIDHVLNDLVESMINASRIEAFYCVPTIMEKSPSWKVKLKQFMLNNSDDLPSIATADAELDR